MKFFSQHPCRRASALSSVLSRSLACASSAGVCRHATTAIAAYYSSPRQHTRYARLSAFLFLAPGHALTLPAASCPVAGLLTAIDSPYRRLWLEARAARTIDLACTASRPQTTPHNRPRMHSCADHLTHLSQSRAGSREQTRYCAHCFSDL